VLLDDATESCSEGGKLMSLGRGDCALRVDCEDSGRCSDCDAPDLNDLLLDREGTESSIRCAVLGRELDDGTVLYWLRCAAAAAGDEGSISIDGISSRWS